MMRKMLRSVSLAVLVSVGFTLPATATAAPHTPESAPTAAVAAPAGVYGPYAIYESCWVAGNNGQQAGQWQSFFCSQNGTDQWWLFTTP